MAAIAAITGTSADAQLRNTLAAEYQRQHIVAANQAAVIPNAVSVTPIVQNGGYPAQKVQTTQGFQGDFRKLPLFMQRVALAVSPLKVYRNNSPATTHAARRLWEAAYDQESTYWSQAWLQPWLINTDIEEVAAEAQAAYKETPRISSSDGVCVALARAVHRFRLIPGARDRGLNWIENAIDEAGRLLRMQADSKGDGGLGDEFKHSTETDYALKQASVSMQAEPEHIDLFLEETQSVVARLKKQLSWAKCRIGVLGSFTFNHPDTEPLMRLVAKQLDERLGNQVCFVTGGVPGAQEAFARGAGNGSRVFNLVPFGEKSCHGIGTDIPVGASLDHRIEVTKFVADLYICAEGGPNVALEARHAVSRGCMVLPLGRLGGASSGMFNFPPEAMKPPTFASDREWALLTNTEASLEQTAGAVVSIISHYVATMPETPKEVLQDVDVQAEAVLLQIEATIAKVRTKFQDIDMRLQRFGR